MDTATCQQCRGTGKIALTGVFAETLELLRRQHGERTGAELSKIDGCNPTAMNNRLAGLERMGFVTSRRFGRKRLYIAKKRKPVRA